MGECISRTAAGLCVMCERLGLLRLRGRRLVGWRKRRRKEWLVVGGWWLVCRQMTKIEKRLEAERDVGRLKRLT